jgi:putative transcriptional regulator
VLNRKYENTIDELIPELESSQDPVVLWRTRANGHDSFSASISLTSITGGQEVMKGIYWGGDFDKVVEMIKNDEIDEKQDSLLYWLFRMERRPIEK